MTNASEQNTERAQNDNLSEQTEPIHQLKLLWVGTKPYLHENDITQFTKTLATVTRQIATNNWENDKEKYELLQLKKSVVFVGEAIGRCITVQDATQNGIPLTEIKALINADKQIPDEDSLDELTNNITTANSNITFKEVDREEASVLEIATAIYISHTESKNIPQSVATNVNQQLCRILCDHIPVLALIGNHIFPWPIDRTGEEHISSDGTRWVVTKTVENKAHIKAIEGDIKGRHEMIPINRLDELEQISFEG